VHEVDELLVPSERISRLAAVTHYSMAGFSLTLTYFPIGADFS